MIYWLDRVWKFPPEVGMAIVGIDDERVYRRYVAKGIQQHEYVAFVRKLPKFKI